MFIVYLLYYRHYVLVYIVKYMNARLNKEINYKKQQQQQKKKKKKKKNGELDYKYSNRLD